MHIKVGIQGPHSNNICHTENLPLAAFLHTMVFKIIFGEGLDIMANVTLLAGHRAAGCTTPCEL